MEWYYRFADVKAEATLHTPTPFYVQRNDRQGHRFAWFSTPLDFFRYMGRLPRDQRNFFETVVGSVRQKPHFDVDIKLEALGEFTNDKQIVDDLIYAILDYAVSVGAIVDLHRDLRIYTSHGSEKRSYHVILTNWYHDDCSEAKSFYQAVVGRLPAHHQHFVDHAVYSRLQQFRTLGSTKHGTDRHKVLVESWTLGRDSTPITPPTHTEEEAFLESLLTYVPTGTRMPVEATPQSDATATVVDDVTLNEAIALLPSYYRYDGWNGHIHRLERISGGECIVCNRTHGTDTKGDNGYLSVRNDTVYLHCFRNRGRSIPLVVKKKDTHYGRAEDATFIPFDSTPETTTEDLLRALRSPMPPSTRQSRATERVLARLRQLRRE